MAYDKDILDRAREEAKKGYKPPAFLSCPPSGKESDPNGKNPHEPGAKLDSGKPPIYRGAIAYFPRAISAVAAVSAFGASKYAWKGWESVPDGFNRYTDAMVRHLVSEGKGEDLDSDSRLLHAAHTAWNALARLEILLKDTMLKENEAAKVKDE